MKPKVYPGAPASADKQVVDQLFRDYCNCYSYAVQDYFAGHLTGLSGTERASDGGYLPRPGQTRGNSYADLKGTNIRGMRRAVCEDGLLFAGATYPKRVPDDKYVICCFLEPKQYHFIRQNQDGSWSSKNGRAEVSFTDDFGEPLTDPENFYHHHPDYPFVGYFLVPKGGIRVGIRAYEEKMLKKFQERPPKQNNQKTLRDLLQRSVALTHASDELKEMALKISASAPRELARIWDMYIQDMSTFALFQKSVRFQRRSLLKITHTRGKEK
ncbi:MAG: hypothetical protein ACI4OR_00460 [Alphaproteobacteria bacterium]